MDSTTYVIISFGMVLVILSRHSLSLLQVVISGRYERTLDTRKAVSQPL